MFMAQSVTPMPTPNSSSTSPSSSGSAINASGGVLTIITAMETMMTRRQPKRLVSEPVTGIAISAPTPRQSSNVPNVASSTPVLARA